MSSVQHRKTNDDSPLQVSSVQTSSEYATVLQLFFSSSYITTTRTERFSSSTARTSAPSRTVKLQHNDPQFIPPPPTTQRPTVSILKTSSKKMWSFLAHGIGCVVLTSVIYNFFVFLHVCFFRPGKNLGKEYGVWAVVTGATDGIGKAMALKLSKQGMKVLLVSRSQDKLELVQKEFKGETEILGRRVMEQSSRPCRRRRGGDLGEHDGRAGYLRTGTTWQLWSHIISSRSVSPPTSHDAPRTVHGTGNIMSPRWTNLLLRTISQPSISRTSTPTHRTCWRRSCKTKTWAWW